jgi:hypothetical protein
MNEHILKAAQYLPLHHPARMALLDAYKQIVELRQCLEVIAELGGKDEVDDETGEHISCTGSWCAEQARTTLNQKETE